MMKLQEPNTIVPVALTDDGFPFRRVLDFTLLIEYWRERAAQGRPLERDIAQRVLNALGEATELHGPIDDHAVLERHRPLVEELLTAAFPHALADQIYGAAFVPYQVNAAHMTPGFRGQGLLEALSTWVETLECNHGMAMSAYHGVLGHFYGIKHQSDLSLVIKAVDVLTGLDRFFRLSIDPRFVQLKLVGERPHLAEDDIARLLSDCMDIALWRRLLPPENFEFHGVLLITAVDVTDQEALAALTRELLLKEAMSSPERLDQLQVWLRTLLKHPGLQLGLIALHHDDISGIEDAHPLGRSLLMSTGAAPHCPLKADSIYGLALKERRTITVHDLEHSQIKTGYEHHVCCLGVRNLLVTPLQVGDEVVGLLELGSDHPGDLNDVSSRKLDQVLGLFATAVKRSLDEEETRIQAVIKQQYTAIHPSVEWRFRDAAHRYIHEQDAGDLRPVEQIAFHDVYALYGLSDIRGSSATRSESIQSDLLEQLELARGVIVEANRANPLPALSELEYRIGRFAAQVGDGLNSGDEIRVHEFLKSEVERLFDQLATFGEEVRGGVEAYRSSIDPQLGVLYRRRKDFEDSVTLINAAIGTYIDEQERHAQRMFPHYFEKYKTDGVDYNIYIGASLQEDGRFDSLYLRNLRLWQLMLMCGVVWRLEELEHRLPMPLHLAHLILAQEAAISIRFRPDEKKFDVDGAYNVRYEIVKKRIDKARVRGTREHLTQPGRIAIVYAQPKQAVEYLQYIEYLQAAGYLEQEVEELELEDLQGVRGLAALRVTVAPRRTPRSENLSARAAAMASV
jgi:hypothetical protein